MVSHLLFYQLALIALVWLFLMCYVAGPIQRAQGYQPPAPRKPRRNRTNDPQPFAGLTHKPHCPRCVHETDHATPLPPVRPAPMKPTNRRPREVDTSLHFCLHEGCNYRGWLGLGNLRANGHPSGGPWRQMPGVTTGKLSKEHAIKRLERSRHWVWTAIDPQSKLLVAMDEGARTLEMAQRMGKDPRRKQRGSLSVFRA